MKSALAAATVLLLCSANARADCNLPLAKATARYLSELEKAHLQKYEDTKPCEVLDTEVRKCSAKQKSALENAVNLREILGNICMPHLSPPKP